MTPFDFQPRTRMVFGPDKIDNLGELSGELGARRAMVVTDQGIVAAGHAERAMAALKRAGIETVIYDQVAENPTTAHVEDGLIIARRHNPEILVGLGGGSSMDSAKGINFLYSGGGRMQDYWGIGKATRPMLPSIAVPTTAGTGSETQSFALISDAETHVKMACGDKKASFRVAILDPALTVSQPARVTALTGVDALAMPWKRMSRVPARPFRYRSAAKRGCCWPRILAGCWTIRPTWKLARPCNWVPRSPDWRSRTRCWGRPTLWPIR